MILTCSINVEVKNRHTEKILKHAKQISQKQFLNFSFGSLIRYTTKPRLSNVHHFHYFSILDRPQKKIIFKYMKTAGRLFTNFSYVKKIRKNVIAIHLVPLKTLLIYRRNTKKKTFTIPILKFSLFFWFICYICSMRNWQ